MRTALGSSLSFCFARKLKPSFWAGLHLPGGEGGIRTHGTVSGTTVFKTVSLNHSDTSPAQEIITIVDGFCQFNVIVLLWSFFEIIEARGDTIALQSTQDLVPPKTTARYNREREAPLRTLCHLATHHHSDGDRVSALKNR